MITAAAQPEDQKWHWPDLHDLQDFRCQKPFSSWEISCKEYWSPPTFLHFELTDWESCFKDAVIFMTMAEETLWWYTKVDGKHWMCTTTVFISRCVLIYHPSSFFFFCIFSCHFNDSNIHLGNIHGHVYLSAYLSKNDFTKEKAMLSFSSKLLHCWFWCTNNLASV